MIANNDELTMLISNIFLILLEKRSKNEIYICVVKMFTFFKIMFSRI